MNKQGFTLVELLAVIVILSLLILIGVPAVTKVIRDGKKQANEVNYDTILTAARDYYLDYGCETGTVTSGDCVITIPLLKTKGLIKDDIKDGDGNLIPDTANVTITKIPYVEGSEYKTDTNEKIFESYLFTYND